MTDINALLTDLVAEGDELDALVSTLDESGWRTPTPAPGWTVAHQIAHLNWTDNTAVLAATDADGFSELLRQAIAQPTAAPVDEAAAAGAAQPLDELLSTWRTGRSAIVAALRGVPDGQKLPWFGPPMSAMSMATARIMETWAHGQDVFDAIGQTRKPTARMQHVAHIGARTVNFAFAVHFLDPPKEPFRIELTAPDGDTWTWGPEDSTNRITGSAQDFCLLVTQRRHRDDLDVTAVGADAERWLPIAQAFAGPPGEGRKPGAFA